MKKILLAIGVIFIAISLFLGIRSLVFKKPVNEDSKKPVVKKVETVNQLPLENRPFIIIEPKSKTKPEDFGHWMTVTVNNVGSYQSVEYDVEYQTGNLIQGFMHRIDFTKESLPVAKEGFFGSESKGKYKYDENVKGGSILYKFYKDSTNYDALKHFFNLQKMEEQKGIFTSNDGKASLEIGKELNANDYVTIATTLGLPEKITGKILSEPYGFFSTREVKLKNATLTIKSKEDLTKAKILGWDGKQWREYKIKIKDDQASTQIANFGTYILVTD